MTKTEKVIIYILLGIILILQSINFYQGCNNIVVTNYNYKDTLISHYKDSIIIHETNIETREKKYFTNSIRVVFLPDSLIKFDIMQKSRELLDK